MRRSRWEKRNTRGGFFLAHVALPLVAGAALYLLARPTSLVLFRWAEMAGFEASVARARDATHGLLPLLPGFVRLSLPNALWVYALSSLLSALWDHRATAASLPWLALGPALGAGFELGQAFGFVPGTFDPVDLALVLAASALALRVPFGRPTLASIRPTP